MDRKEAQAILGALRPGSPEAAHSPFAEALALVGRDPVLARWWTLQQEFDHKVSSKLEEIPVPSDLRERILAGQKIVAFRPRLQYSSWLAMAAMVAVLCVAGTFWTVANFGPVDRAEYTAQLLPALGHDNPHLALATPDHETVKAWLNLQKAPMGSMPGKLASLPSLGCQKYLVHGHTVSLVCFALADGHIAHLFMVEKSALTDPPSQSGPEFDEKEGWKIASWSDDRMSYLLATSASAETLKQLL